jgi:hypothetical protein
MTLAIYALGALSTIGFVIFGVLYSSHKTQAVWFLFFPSTMMVITAGCLYWHQEIGKEAKAKETPLTLENPTFKEKPTEVTFSLGGGGFSVVYRWSKIQEMPVEPFSLDGFSPVRLYVEGRKLFADVTVYGGTNAPPIKIDHNEFTIRPPNWDRNSNASALEIVNGQGFPVFQMIYRTPFHIVVNGIIPFPSGVFYATDSGTQTIFNPKGQLKFPVIKRLFKYPSWKYPGQFDDSPQ